MDIRTISIEEIGLSVRSLNALRRAEVLTVGDMLQHTEESLMQIRNLGRKSVQEILEKIAEYTQYLEADIVPPGFEEQPSNAINPEEWVFADENREEVLAYIREKSKRKLKGLIPLGRTEQKTEVSCLTRCLCLIFAKV